jgi:hypothetical protein
VRSCKWCSKPVADATFGVGEGKGNRRLTDSVRNTIGAAKSALYAPSILSMCLTYSRKDVSFHAQKLPCTNPDASCGSLNPTRLSGAQFSPTWQSAHRNRPTQGAASTAPLLRAAFGTEGPVRATPAQLRAGASGHRRCQPPPPGPGWASPAAP